MRELIRVEKIRKRNSRLRICLESSGLSYINIPEQLGGDPGSSQGFQRQLRQKERKFALPREKTTREALDVSVIPWANIGSQNIQGLGSNVAEVGEYSKHFQLSWDKRHLHRRREFREIQTPLARVSTRSWILTQHGRFGMNNSFPEGKKSSKNSGFWAHQKYLQTQGVLSIQSLKIF